MNPTIQSLAVKLLNHQIYNQIRSLEELRIFMENHVFAVWDFMSLLKSLQLHLTSVYIPWSPPEDPQAARLINEIVLCEESDINMDGKAASHLDMYLEAMEEIGANTHPFRTFLNGLNLNNLEHQLKQAQTPQYVRVFVMHNLHLSLHGTVEEIASNFLYGREDSIPEMFDKLLTQLRVPQTEAPKMHYYLKRHIEVDSDEHGPAASKLLEKLIGNDPQARKRAETSAGNAITARLTFWDGLLDDILKLREA
jgi:hypothetical protein